MIRSKLNLFVGFFDQGLISISNLLIGLLLINSVPKAEYGIYVVANACILLGLGFSNGMINTQMSVSFPDKLNRKKYCEAMLSSLLVMALSFSFIALITSFFMAYTEIISNENLEVICAVLVSLVSILVHEFFRRYYLISSDTLNVLKIDVVYLVIMLSGIFILKNISADKMYIKVIYLYGFSTFIAALLASYKTRLFVSDSFAEVKYTVVDSWLHGKWALFGVVITWLQSQSYIFLLALLMTAESVASANASRLFLSPMALIIVSYVKIFMPRMAVLKNKKGGSHVFKYANRISVLLVVVVLLYGVIIYFLYPHLAAKYMGEEYVGLSDYILAWSGVFLIQVFRVNYSTVLQVVKEFRYISVSILMSSVTVIVVSWFMIDIYEVIGSIFSLIVGEVLLVFLFYRKLAYVK